MIVFEYFSNFLQTESQLPLSYFFLTTFKEGINEMNEVFEIELVGFWKYIFNKIFI